MIRRKRSALAGALLLSLVATAALWRLAPADNPLSTSTTPTAVPAARSDFVQLWWQANTDHRYAFEQTASLQSGEGVLVSFQLRGTLHLVPLVPAQRALYVTFEGSIEALDGSKSQSAGSRDAVSRELHRPFVIDYGNDGLHSGVRFESGVSEFTAQNWRALASALDFRYARGASTYSAREPGALGECDIQYEIRAATRVEKTKLRCAPIASPVGYAELSSTQTFELGTDASLKSMVSRERVTTEAQPPIPSFTAQGSVVLRHLEDRTLSQDLAQLVDHAQQLAQASARAAAKEAAGLDELERARIGNRTMPSALAELSELAAVAVKRELTREEYERAGRARIALKALMRTDPRNVSTALQHIQQGGPLTDSLIGTLGEAGTPEAQRALATVLETARLERVQRLDVTRALSQVGAPTAETVAKLESLTRDPDVGLQATYGLGSNVYRLQQQQPELANQIMTKLISQLGRADTNGEKHMLLTALGNAGSPEGIAAIQAHLQDPSDVVRAAAANALRRIPGPEAEALLAVTTQDTASNVRYAAQLAIAQGEPTVLRVEAVSRAITSDPDFDTRARAIQTAAQWIRQHAELAEPLKVAANTDSDPSIRTAAANILGSSGHN